MSITIILVIITSLSSLVGISVYAENVICDISNLYFNDIKQVDQTTNLALNCDIIIAGIEVTDENSDDILGDGTTTYKSNTNELTLNNSNISQNQGNYGIYINGDLNIQKKRF